MSENKIARIPVASHGLHKHSYNYPWLSSINFGDVMPCYYNSLRRGERDSVRGGMYSQLMPIAHNAFATGRYNFKAVFVPYKLVWRPWYAFDQQTNYYSNGESFIPGRYPYVTDSVLSEALVHSYGTSDGASADHYDVVINPQGNTQASNLIFYLLTPVGRRILRILGALGCSPSFIDGDVTSVNILPLLCYIKAFSDYYFPNNYVGNLDYQNLSLFFDTDTVDFNNLIVELLKALETCSLNFYENSVFDLAWDNPLSPSSGLATPPIQIKDVTAGDDIDDAAFVTNQIEGDKTPDVALNKNNTFSQYVLDALQSVTLWMKRRQLSGARLLDKFLVSRGISLPDDSARISYFVGQRNIEIEVSGVENNTDVNLGELAGRGVSSSGNQPLSFDCKPDDDGIFFVIVSPVPDANFPVYKDGFSMRKTYLDNYNAEYDKLGSAPVPSRVVYYSMHGMFNDHFTGPNSQAVFGFLNRYWDEIQEKPRLLGDFCLQSRGARELEAYHTFRTFHSFFPQMEEGFFHSYNFVRMEDNSQYQRLFYNADQENLMLFLRWYGNQYKEKLPLGDSYDWDDDEMNRKVSVVVGGSQK